MEGRMLTMNVKIEPISAGEENYKGEPNANFKPEKTYLEQTKK